MTRFECDRCSHLSPTYSLSWVKLLPFTGINLLLLPVLSLLTIMSDAALLFWFFVFWGFFNRFDPT